MGYKPKEIIHGHNSFLDHPLHNPRVHRELTGEKRIRVASYLPDLVTADWVFNSGNPAQSERADQLNTKAIRSEYQALPDVCRGHHD